MVALHFLGGVSLEGDLIREKAAGYPLGGLFRAPTTLYETKAVVLTQKKSIDGHYGSNDLDQVCEKCVMRLLGPIQSVLPVLLVLLNAEYSRAQQAGAESATDSAVLVVVSDPVGASIFHNGTEIDAVTPASFSVKAGDHAILVMLEGWEPLDYQFVVEAGETATLSLVLLALPPPPFEAASLGLEYLAVKPIIDEAVAAKLRERWSDWSEAFAVVPLGQGVVARLVLPEEHAGAANAMILSGAALTVGSFLMGKFLGKRKLAWIKAYNETVPAENETAKRHNREVTQMVNDAYDAAVMTWEEQNINRGEASVSYQ